MSRTLAVAVSHASRFRRRQGAVYNEMYGALTRPSRKPTSPLIA